MNSREFAEGLLSCVMCAENWSQAPWSSLGGRNLIAESTKEMVLVDGTTVIEMKVRVHTDFAEDDEGEWTPSTTERFTIQIVKGART